MQIKLWRIIVFILIFGLGHLRLFFPLFFGYFFPFGPIFSVIYVYVYLFPLHFHLLLVAAFVVRVYNS